VMLARALQPPDGCYHATMMRMNEGSELLSCMMSRVRNCETGVCLHAATLLYTCTVIPDTLLIRDCGHEDLRVTIYQWSEITMVRILLEVGELLCVATLALHRFPSTSLLPPAPSSAHLDYPHHSRTTVTHAALLRFATFFENDLLPVR
jgi:hypothetical protein